MLIINADDFGRNAVTTDRVLACHKRGTVTSTSAMVFMEDSERAAGLAKQTGLDTGLHLNFTEEFTDGKCDPALRTQHRRIVRYLKQNRFASLLYHPLLRAQFRQVFEAQLEEYIRLYGAPPSHIDGHHHMHLCANVLWGGLLPDGQKVRRNFTFRPGEKSWLNRMYRSMIDRWFLRKHRCTDFLFSLPACLRSGGINRVIELAGTAEVELETHPEVAADYDFLMSDEFLSAISVVKRGSYAHL